MKNRDLVNILLSLLNEEVKRAKKGKKKKSTPIFTRPINSLFAMDVNLSLADTGMLSESIIKPITKKFDHLKWKLDDFQKQFLDDFISISDELLKKEDFVYASKRTGIPVENIKSIKNTLSDKKTIEQIQAEQKKLEKELGLGGAVLSQDIIDDANSEMTNIRDLPQEKSGKQWSMNPNPKFRSQTPAEAIYNSEYGSNGGLQKQRERPLPSFLYEWLMYAILGEENLNINDSKLLDELNSTNTDKYKFVLFSVDFPIKESKAHPYDIVSNTKLEPIRKIEERVDEFNKIFGTNFVVFNQFTGEDGLIKIVFENAQLTDGKNVFNREFLDMSDTDISKAMRLGFYDIDATIRSITE